MLKYKYFAIDFDNTIAYDAHPNVGKLIPGAKETIQKIKELGGQICIWTCRTGDQAELVKRFLKDNYIPYDKFNEGFDNHIQEYGGDCRKVYADVYIDDRCLLWQESIVDWDKVEELIFEEEDNDIWKERDLVECIKPIPGTWKIGDRENIVFIDNDLKIITIGPMATDLDLAKEYFKKVK